MENSTQQKQLYHDEIVAFLDEIYREEWMDERDWREYLRFMTEEWGITIESVSMQLQEGVANGYSVADQFQNIRNLLNK